MSPVSQYFRLNYKRVQSFTVLVTRHISPLKLTSPTTLESEPLFANTCLKLKGNIHTAKDRNAHA